MKNKVIILIFVTVIAFSCNDLETRDKIKKPLQDRGDLSLSEYYQSDLGLKPFNANVDSIVLFIWYNMFFENQELIEIRLRRDRKWLIHHYKFLRVDYRQPHLTPDSCAEKRACNVTLTDLKLSDSSKFEKSFSKINFNEFRVFEHPDSLDMSYRDDFVIVGESFSRNYHTTFQEDYIISKVYSSFKSYQEQVKILNLIDKEFADKSKILSRYNPH